VWPYFKFWQPWRFLAFDFDFVRPRKDLPWVSTQGKSYLGRTKSRLKAKNRHCPYTAKSEIAVTHIHIILKYSTLLQTNVWILQSCRGRITVTPPARERDSVRHQSDHKQNTVSLTRVSSEHHLRRPRPSQDWVFFNCQDLHAFTCWRPIVQAQRHESIWPWTHSSRWNLDSWIIFFEDGSEDFFLPYQNYHYNKDSLLQNSSDFALTTT